MIDQNQFKSTDEKALIEAAKRNVDAFEALYNIYYDRLFRFIYRRTDSENLTADLCSQTFYKALKGLKKYQYTGSPFGAWLFQIAGNEIRKHFRDKKQLFVIEEDRAVSLWEQTPESGLPDSYTISQVFEELTEAEMQLIEMKYFEDFTFKEIAAYTDEKESTIKMRLYRLLDRMKTLIKR